MTKINLKVNQFVVAVVLSEVTTERGKIEFLPFIRKKRRAEFPFQFRLNLKIDVRFMQENQFQQFIFKNIGGTKCRIEIEVLDNFNYILG